MTIVKPKCRCVAKANRALKDRYTYVETTTFSEMVIVRTSLTYLAPRRSKAVALIASFCPFCGVEYPRAETRTAKEARA